MKRMRTDRVLLAWSVMGFFSASISFLLMPLESLRILPGALFWGGLIVGVLLQVILEHRRRAFFAAYNMPRQKMQKPRNGLCSFGSNRAAVIADRVMGLCVAAMILVLVLTKGYGFWCYLCIAMAVFSFCLHCVFNGRIYFHAKNQLKVRQVLENRKAEAIKKGDGKNEKL